MTERDMTAPRAEAATYDRYLADANAEVEAILGTVSEEEPATSSRPRTDWTRLLLVALVAVVVFAIGLVLLRGRRSNRMALNSMR
jgi:hypothetical protein